MPKKIVKIRFNVDSARAGVDNLRTAFSQAAERGVMRAAKQLLNDCRPYIPMLTGRLRDSGKVVSIETQLENYAFKLVWDAANPRNGYVYAERQYNEVLQHVDGKYAAQWVRRTIVANPDRYRRLSAEYTTLELETLFRGGGDVRNSE